MPDRARRPSVSLLPMAARLLASALGAALLLTTCRDDQGLKTSTEPTTLRGPSFATEPGAVTLVGAGDISSCAHHNDTSTAKLLDAIPGTVFTTGDNAAPSGASTDYANCYDPTWGRQKARTRPAPGEAEYGTAGAAGYFGYFGVAAGDPSKGYYSYDLGTWHIVVLNSNIDMSAGSAQEQWLKADLAATTAQCTLAYWHYPRFYSGTSTTRASVKPLWDDLYAADAEVVLNAHTRNYERFAPQTPAGALDTVRGIREFVVGTGGLGTWSFYTIAPNSQVRAQLYGVLKLTLNTGSYSWQFVPIAGTQFSDSGTTACHGPAGPPPPPPPPTPVVNAGPDLTTYPGVAVNLSVAFSDTGATDAPWTYSILWGDGASSTGSASSASTPITASHTYAALGLDSVRVTVTNSAGRSGSDAVAVRVVAPGTQVALISGDIADCSTGSGKTASILDTIAGTVITAGDNAYPTGASADYTNCYAPSWGRHLYRTYAAVGNHDYGLGNANGTFDYFGAAAGPRGLGYYSFDIGSWHVVMLNSNYTFVPTAAGSAQELWLKSDLAGAAGKCILAVWHHPRFYSSTTSPLSAGSSTLPFWNDLYAAHADVIVNGHMHDYERFAPTDPAGNLDVANGIREIIAGAGGGGMDAPNTVFWPNSQVRISGVYGVLKLTLSSSAYSWQFIPVSGTATDSGTTACHNAGAAVNSPPTAAPGGPYSGTEGTAVGFNGSASSDPNGDALTYAWNFGDGGTGTGATPSHTYADNGTYTVTLTVTDAPGAASGPATTTATIANAVPSVTLPANQAGTAGSAYALSASFGDAGVSDAPWAYAIDWGDGSPQTTGTTSTQSAAITASHTYAAGGTDTVRVTVTDKDGGAASAQTPVAVAAVNHPPTAAPGGPYSSSEGAAVAFNGAGSSDPDGDALTYAWSFGDGATGTGATPSHTYADNGSYTVTLTVTDTKGAASAPVAVTATVANAAPVVNAGANQAANAGSPVTLNAGFSDPGANDAPWSYAIDWGDGTPQTTGSKTSQGAITAGHTYTAAGTNTLRLTVTDKDGGAGAGQAIVTVSQPPASVTMLLAGNIARCDRTNDEATAAMLDTMQGTVVALGDNAYPNGTAANFQNCYDPTWGRHKARTYPVVGNHEYDSSATAVSYFNYFGPAAGDPTKGYYSYDLGAWHIVVLNSNSSFVPAALGSAQEVWLKADLAATTKRCVLATFHHPRFYSTTSASFSPTNSVKPFWDDLYAAGAELIVNAHMRDYERFAPQTPAGAADPVNGIRQIIVGTGGEGLDQANTLIIPNSEVQVSGVYGLLKLTLSDGSYSWQFVRAGGAGVGDSGSGTCH